jgi:hypothetical protein
MTTGDLGRIISPRRGAVVMNRSSKPSRTSSILSDSVLEHLNRYAVAATAAGVGVLAATPPAEAKIVYTPAHIRISPHHMVSLDLNHDGKTDFTLDDTLYTTTASSFVREDCRSNLRAEIRHGGTERAKACITPLHSLRALRLEHVVRLRRARSLWLMRIRRAVHLLAKESGTTFKSGI